MWSPFCSLFLQQPISTNTRFPITSRILWLQLFPVFWPNCFLLWQQLQHWSQLVVAARVAGHQHLFLLAVCVVFCKRFFVFFITMLLAQPIWPVNVFFLFKSCVTQALCWKNYSSISACLFSFPWNYQFSTKCSIFSLQEDQVVLLECRSCIAFSSTWW